MKTALSSERESKISFDSVEAVVKLFESCQEEWQEELVKHYLLNFILYLDLEDMDRDKSPIKKTLLKIEGMLQNAVILVKDASSSENRLVDLRIMKTQVRKKKGKSKTPRQKFKNNSEKLNERTKKKDDYSIDFEVKKSSKFK
ncbi:hypothetical protein GINT2_000242 [Glugoides intestinalis]